MQLANETIDARTLIALYVEMRLHVFKREQLTLPLEVSAVIPLHHLVFNFTDSTQVAMNLHDTVWMLLMMILVIGKHRFLRGNAELRLEPLKGINVQQPLHAEEIDCYFHVVSLADLDYRLDARSLHNLFYGVHVSVQFEL